MSWQDPKTDWTPKDYFNVSDYGRIVSNIKYVKKLSEYLFEQYEILKMEDEKQYYSMIYASEINTIEKNIEILNNNTFHFDIGSTKTYKPNEYTPNYEEFNRIENALLKLYMNLNVQIEILNHLEFKLGTKSFGKRAKFVHGEQITYRTNFRLGSRKGVLK